VDYSAGSDTSRTEERGTVGHDTFGPSIGWGLLVTAPAHR